MSMLTLIYNYIMFIIELMIYDSNCNNKSCQNTAIWYFIIFISLYIIICVMWVVPNACIIYLHALYEISHTENSPVTIICI